MGAKDRRQHLERALALGGSVMTAKGSLVRNVNDLPSSARLATTPEERAAARADLERRARELEAETRLLDDGDWRDEDEDERSESVARRERLRRRDEEGEQSGARRRDETGAGEGGRAGEERGEAQGEGAGEELASRTVAELREMARERGITGAGQMNKADLVAALEAE